MDTLPPFALGNFYILSGQLATYLARNSQELRTTGTLEDLSIGIWMLGLQVKCPLIVEKIHSCLCLCILIFIFDLFWSIIYNILFHMPTSTFSRYTYLGFSCAYEWGV